MFTSDEDMDKVREIVKRMVKRAIALGGTCTGEHGVGIGKREYLYEELGYGTVELMKKIKSTIDPYNLFNPGKVCCVFVFTSDCLVLSSCSCTQTCHPNMLGEAPMIFSDTTGYLYVRRMHNALNHYNLILFACEDTMVMQVAYLLHARHYLQDFPSPYL